VSLQCQLAVDFLDFLFLLGHFVVMSVPFCLENGVQALLELGVQFFLPDDKSLL
jgi:hypothetical protein